MYRHRQSLWKALHTFCPSGACPRDRPGSPFSPWKREKWSHFLQCTALSLHRQSAHSLPKPRDTLFAFTLSASNEVILLFGIFTRACGPFMPSRNSVYTEEVSRSDCGTFFSLFGQARLLGAFWVSVRRLIAPKGENSLYVSTARDPWGRTDVAGLDAGGGGLAYHYTRFSTSTYVAFKPSSLIKDGTN